MVSFFFVLTTKFRGLGGGKTYIKKFRKGRRVEGRGRAGPKGEPHVGKIFLMLVWKFFVLYLVLAIKTASRALFVLFSLCLYIFKKKKGSLFPIKKKDEVYLGDLFLIKGWGADHNVLQKIKKNLLFSSRGGPPESKILIAEFAHKKKKN